MKKILVVDDEPLVRRSLKKVLTPQFEVIEAEDGIQGLEAWKKEKPDLVFLDVLMPGLSGFQVLAEIPEEIRKQAKVVLMSAYSGDYDLERSKADKFLAKPFESIFMLVEVAEELLGLTAPR